MSKSIWRNPKAQHFELVHRSQRDPLSNDPDADQRVLAPRQRANELRRPHKAGLTRAQLEQAGANRGQRANVGEAARYGVYYDDTDYDYMQHLKTVGQPGEATEGDEPAGPTFLLEAPSKNKPPKQTDLSTGVAFKESAAESPPASETAKSTLSGLQLPPEAIPSAMDQNLPYRHAPGQKEGQVTGLQPDLNAHLRQTLEALDDEAFVEDDLEDNFFEGIVHDGTQDTGADNEPDWMEEAPEGEERLWLSTADLLKAKADQGEKLDEANMSLTERVALFKAGGLPGAPPAGSSDEEAEEGEAADELGSLPGIHPARKRAPRAASSSGGSTSIFGEENKRKKAGVKARYAASQAGKSAFSMSSSAMSRNKGLSEVDTRFDAILRQYGRLHLDDEDASAFGAGVNDEEDEKIAMEAEARADEEEAEEEEAADAEMSEAQKQALDRAMDDFIAHYDVFGGKLAPKLGGRELTAAEKVGLVRQSLGGARIDEDALAAEEEKMEKDPDYGMPEVRIIGSNREKWDVETVRTTRTNLENHPRTINAASVSVAPSTAYAPTTLGSQRLSSQGTLESGVEPKVKIDPRTGLSKVIGYQKRRHAAPSSSSSDPSSTAPTNDPEQPAASQPMDGDEGSDSGESDVTIGALNGGTIIRPRGESAEDKKARKQAAKQDKALRRQQKSATKQAFKSEAKRQAGMRGVAASKAGDVSSAERAGALRL